MATGRHQQAKSRRKRIRRHAGIGPTLGLVALLKGMSSPSLLSLRSMTLGVLQGISANDLIVYANPRKPKWCRRAV